MQLIEHYWLAWIWAIAAAPFVGSFLGVLVLRIPAGLPVGLARSACPHCGHRLGVGDLVPVFSWVFSGGRCRHCSAELGLFYPAIELAAVAIALWAAAVLPGSLVLAGCVLGWALLAAAVVDWRHMFLPDIIVLPLIPLGIALHAVIDGAVWYDHLLGAAAGFALFAGVAVLYRSVRGREGLGLGDAKLLAAAGAWVSWTGLPSVVLVAALLGLAGVAVSRLAGWKPDPTAEIPFGPPLATATWLIWLYGPLVTV